jgi:hypothetical protein
MCGPVAGILKAGVGAMGAVAQYNAQVEDFNNAEDRWQENYALSRDASMDEQHQITAKMIQMQTETSQKMQLYAAEGAIAEAEAEAGAATAGVGGNSVDEVIRNITAGAATNRYVTETNAKWKAIQMGKEMKATVTNFKARVASVTRPTPPNPAGAFLGIAGSILGAF